MKNSLGFGQGAQSFLFGAVSLVLLTIPYSIYLSILSRNESKDFLYLATGVNLLEESVPSFLVPVLVVATFQAVTVLTYSILRIGTSTILAAAGTIIFLTSAQVALVFMSAPLWDMTTYIAPLAIALLALLTVLIPTWSVLPAAEIFYRISSRVFVVAMIFVSAFLLVANARGLRLILIGSRNVSFNAQFFFTLILACGLLVLSITIIFYRRRIIRALEFRRESSALVTITAVMSAIILVAPLINSRRSYSGASSILLLVLILAPLFLPIKRQLKLRAMLSSVLLATIIASTLGVGAVSPSSFAFYLTSGWQSASQLVAGLHSSSVLAGVHFSDSAIASFVEQQGLGPLEFLWVLGPMFMLVNLNYAYIGVHYLFGGTWLYPEPPVGADGIFWDARMFVVGSLGMLSTVFGVVAIILVLRLHRRIGAFLLSVIAVMVLLIAFSRPQMHQWWIVPIFGVWAMIYCLHIAFAWARGTLSSSTFSIERGTRTISIGTGGLAIFFRTFLVASITAIAIFSVATFSDFVGPRVNTVVSKIQYQAQGKSLDGYSGLPWATVKQSKSLSNGDESLPSDVLFEIPKGTSLIRVDVAENCSLSGWKFALQNEDTIDTTYTTRYFVGESPSNVAYLPVIQTGEQKISRLLLQGKFPACKPSVAVVPVAKGEEPIVGWLPKSCLFVQPDTSVCPPKLEGGGGGRTYQLFPPINFEGYLVPEVPMKTRDSSGEAASSISAKVLGLGNHGYMAKDVWVSGWKTMPEQDSIRVSGELLRGTSIIGVEFDRPNGISSQVPLVNYAVNGSIFNRGGSRIMECFVIPAGARYRVFIGGVTDVYSPSWNKIRIKEISIGNPCDELSYSEQWLPTLD